jgi:hypothetical protein
MTVAGGPFVITNIVDGAAPVIKSICFDPTSAGDELHVVFSEPVAGLNPPLDPNTVFTLYTRNGNGKFTFTSTNPKNIIKNNDNFVYVFTASTLTSLDSLIEGKRPPFHLSLCGGVSIVKDYRVIGNPFIPGQTLVPVTGTVLKVGTRIEVSLVPAIVANLINDKVTGTMTIFDAVGNTVADNLLMLKDEKDVKVFWFWDGKTKKGSMAAPGTYLARVVITDLTQGKKQNIHMNIGVRNAPK